MKYFKVLLLLFGIVMFLWLSGCQNSKTNLNLESSVDNKVILTRNELEDILSKAITMQPLNETHVCFYPPCVEPTLYNPDLYRQDLEMLVRLDARFIGRVAGLWGDEHRINLGYFDKAQITLNDIREIYEENNLKSPVVQAGLFEIITKDVDGIIIPVEVAEEFNQVSRNFRYKDMLYDNGYGIDEWGKNTAIPDMSKIETQMWFYFQATEYIRRGFEALHFGQVMIMNRNDPGNVSWWNLLSKIRKFAENYNRGWVLCDAHTHGEYFTDSDTLLFDFHSAPIRPLEVEGSHRGKGNGGETYIDIGVRDVIYGKSKGGKTYLGWETVSLPFLIEFDNNNISEYPNQGGIGWWVWGWDEITWYALQSKEYQIEWLKYADRRIKELDKNGFLQMPGLKLITRQDEKWPDIFRAADGNDKSHYGIESAIRELWIN